MGGGGGEGVEAIQAIAEQVRDRWTKSINLSTAPYNFHRGIQIYW
jgi:hypothetical protein